MKQASTTPDAFDVRTLLEEVDEELKARRKKGLSASDFVLRDVLIWERIKFLPTVVQKDICEEIGKLHKELCANVELGYFVEMRHLQDCFYEACGEKFCLRRQPLRSR